MDNAKIKTDIAAFCFNPFQENTYVISAANKECWIIRSGLLYATGSENISRIY
jgi:hypothetical protein